MSKMLKFHEEALSSIRKGVETMAKAVIVTLGPKGRNVVINRGFGAPLSTKDGVTVAKEITLKEKFENMGAQLVKEASSKTNDVAGDGTTTAIVLSQAIFGEGLKYVVAGHNPMSVKRGIEKCSAAVVTALQAQAKEISKPEEIRQIATISANNDPEVGAMIAQAMEKVGKDGTITIGEAKGIEMTLDIKEGMQFDKGYLSPYFVTNAEKMTAELDSGHILIVDKKIGSAKELVPFLEKVVAAGSKPLLIIAEDFDDEALSTLVVNKLRGGLPLCAVKAPGFGDRRKALLQDIATLTGATVVSEEVGLSLETVDCDVLGSAKTIKVAKEETTLVDGLGNADAIQERIAQIKRELMATDSDYDREKLEERLAKLVGGVAVINVGAATETEMKEIKMRVEDALHATRAATHGGVVVGGGVALLLASKALENLKLPADEEVGREIIRKACLAPVTAISNNCGKQGNLVAEKILEKGEESFGYNALTDTYCNLIEAGVIDPALVPITALQNASSISALMVTIAAMITDKPEPKKAPPQGMDGGMDPMGGMGGMMGGMGGMGMM